MKHVDCCILVLVHLLVLAHTLVFSWHPVLALGIKKASSTQGTKIKNEVSAIAPFWLEWLGAWGAEKVPWCSVLAFPCALWHQPCLTYIHEKKGRPKAKQCSKWAICSLLFYPSFFAVPLFWCVRMLIALATQRERGGLFCPFPVIMWQKGAPKQSNEARGQLVHFFFTLLFLLCVCVDVSECRHPFWLQCVRISIACTAGPPQHESWWVSELPFGISWYKTKKIPTNTNRKYQFGLQF